ncbi:MAG: hypothetical protein AAFX01_10325 [Cyanobacteria bacterium J06638_28]
MAVSSNRGSGHVNFWEPSKRSHLTLDSVVSIVVVRSGKLMVGVAAFRYDLNLKETAM